MDDSGITCDETINTDAKLHDEEAKTIPKNFNEKKYPAKHKFLHFTCNFIN